NSDLLGNYNIKSLLIKLSIPAILGMSVNALYNIVDAYFVSHSNGGIIAIGALAIAFPLHMVIVAIALMVGVGGASVFSRAFGRGDKKTMINVVNTAIRMDFILALLITIFGLLFLDELLVLFGATSSNIEYARDYLGIILLGIIPMSLQMVLNNLTRAEGKANIAMVSMILGAGINIILDPFFIFENVNIFGLVLPGLNYGVKGAAIATVISQVIGFTFIFSVALSKKSELHINLKNWLDVHFETIRNILLIGGPTFIRNTIWALLAIIIYNLINIYAIGDSAIYISIYGVINRVFFFIFLPGYGVVQGLVPIVGFNYGAKKHDRVKDVIIFATQIVIVYFTMGFVFVQFCAPWIFKMFSSDSAVFFIEYGSEAFRIISIGYILVGFHIILGATYQALGYPLKAFLISILRQLLLFIPIVFILTPYYGLMGIWYTFAIADIIAGLVSLVILYYEIGVMNKKVLKQKTHLI
ncbi:MAG: MATE family efflux transporter, partial [Candidatus Izimaplasma sp.]|nr:MATE family efflux transporter [Candidatus Izimaplasma bacterium]